MKVSQTPGETTWVDEVFVRCGWHHLIMLMVLLAFISGVPALLASLTSLERWSSK